MGASAISGSILALVDSGPEGTIMALVATRDLPADSEVLVDYGYPERVYNELNITLSDQQCSKVTGEIIKSRLHFSMLQGVCYDVGEGFGEENTDSKNINGHWTDGIYSDI